MAGRYAGRCQTTCLFESKNVAYSFALKYVDLKALIVTIVRANFSSIFAQVNLVTSALVSLT
jgi:hypothetical protein